MSKRSALDRLRLLTARKRPAEVDSVVKVILELALRIEQLERRLVSIERRLDPNE